MKYQITAYEETIKRAIFEIEADSADEARDKGEEMLQEDDSIKWVLRSGTCEVEGVRLLDTIE